MKRKKNYLIIFLLFFVSSLNGEVLLTNQTFLHVNIKLKDGSKIYGTAKEQNILILTLLDQLTIPLKIIKKIEVKEKNNSLIFLTNNDQITGEIKNESLNIKTILGDLKIQISSINSIDISTIKSFEFFSDNLILYYSFDKDEGNIILDKSGNGNNGEIKGAIYTTDKFGGAYQVGKNFGYIKTPNSELWNFNKNPFTISLWIKLNSIPENEEMIIGCDEGSGERNKWALEFFNRNIDFHINNTQSESYRIVSYPWNIKIKEWVHIALTRNKSEYKLYINGECVKTDYNSLDIPEVDAPLTIGQAEGLYINAIIDEIMLFNKSLTQEEILQIFNINK